MKKDLVKYIFSLFAVCIGLLSNDIAAQQTKASGNSDNLNLAPTRKYKKARALQSSTAKKMAKVYDCLLYTSPSPRDRSLSRMPSSA